MNTDQEGYQQYTSNAFLKIRDVLQKYPAQTGNDGSLTHTLFGNWNATITEEIKNLNSQYLQRHQKHEISLRELITLANDLAGKFVSGLQRMVGTEGNSTIKNQLKALAAEFQTAGIEFDKAGIDICKSPAELPKIKSEAAPDKASVPNTPIKTTTPPPSVQHLIDPTQTAKTQPQNPQRSLMDDIEEGLDELGRGIDTLLGNKDDAYPAHAGASISPKPLTPALKNAAQSANPRSEPKKKATPQKAAKTNS